MKGVMDPQPASERAGVGTRCWGVQRSDLTDVERLRLAEDKGDILHVKADQGRARERGEAKASWGVSESDLGDETSRRRREPTHH